MTKDKPNLQKHYLLASDFDQTLSFNDSGIILSELIGLDRFEEKASGMARINLVQQGGELAYLLLHDPEFRCVRREHLIEVGKRIRLKQNIKLLTELLARGIEDHSFSFYVISAAPEEVIQSALEGIVPTDHIYGTRLNFDPANGEIRSIARVSAGYGKVAVLDELQARLNISPDRIIYVGDGSSDIHVMLHVNRREGFTIAVSEGKYIGTIAQRSILSDDALSILVPILEDIIGKDDPMHIRAFFELRGLRIHEWDKVQTDFLTIRQSNSAPTAQAVRTMEVANV
jgi:HAD superfamily phosphoserine phosphatase-like hydrolase